MTKEHSFVHIGPGVIKDRVPKPLSEISKKKLARAGFAPLTDEQLKEHEEHLNKLIEKFGKTNVRTERHVFKPVHNNGFDAPVTGTVNWDKQEAIPYGNHPFQVQPLGPTPNRGKVVHTKGGRGNKGPKKGGGKK